LEISGPTQSTADQSGICGRDIALDARAVDGGLGRCLLIEFLLIEFGDAAIAGSPRGDIYTLSLFQGGSRASAAVDRELAS
jgi:hypothetical protein